ncbi:glycosyl-4,4'-diaponeurosporenoate acyltransferase [Macrococcus equipercicus]|uniref:Glycosyl-4,4'-diaponeurosporenoate acyltransferase n=1 Tax=Macrococcus equipercicus TaxID=69967 RepID=A0ABQ6R8W9_9STAP|nr:glycosyl-4,4'-diaponeurosporenoate acyltransferase [Macrococcus equipercicus]KAA1039591.1 glycosyl-4,4'-diaponeurosporenoate acyltransferase [Macrococcus equipercicus]
MKQLVLRNIAAWSLINIGNSFVMSKLPVKLFSTRKLFKTYRWEHGGELWQIVFNVKAWKHRLPDGTLFIKSGHNKSVLPDYRAATLNTFFLEMRRAELTHWITMTAGLLFFFWNPRWAALLNILFGIISNAPFIITQRYNRPRIEKLYHQKQHNRM